MNQYHPEINTAAYSVEWLQTRREHLAKIGLYGSINEKKSAHRKAELAAIDTGLKARGEKAMQVRRPNRAARRLPDSGPADVARPRLDCFPPPAQRPLVSTGYSSAVNAVNSDYQPRKNSVYA
ncbi:hypothetical protein [Hymenobacter ruber]